MKDLVEVIAGALVDDPSAVVVTEEEDDILEEYTTGQEESAAAGDQDFIDFLGDWNEKMEKMDEAPYIHSMFSSYFEMGERMLDLMLAEMEEDQPLG